MFWEFLFKLFLISELVVLPTSWSGLIDYDSNIGQVNYIVKAEDQLLPTKVVND